MGRLDELGDAVRKLVSEIGEVNPSAARRHAGVIFDPRRGLGDTPDAANIAYRGYQAYLTPEQFLAVNPRRDLETRPIDHIRASLQGSQAIGTPMLYVDKSPSHWQVRGHEGRGRMMAMQDIDPASLYPVAVHPYGEVRARHLTPEDLFRPLLPGEGGSDSAVPDLVIWNGRPHVRPDPANAEAVLRALREFQQ